MSSLSIKVLRSNVFAGEFSSYDPTPSGGTTCAHPGNEVRIRVGEVDAAVLTDDVEPGDGFAFGVKRVHVRVDHDAVERAERVARILEAVERRLLFRKSYSKLLDVFSDFFPHFTRVRAALSKVGCIQLKPLEGQ